MIPAQNLAYAHPSDLDISDAFVAQIITKPLAAGVQTATQAVEQDKPVSFPTTLGRIKPDLEFYLPVAGDRAAIQTLIKAVSDDLHAAAPAGLDRPSTPVTLHVAYQDDASIAAIAPADGASRHVMIIPFEGDQSLHATLRDNLGLHRAIDQIAGRGRLVMVADFSAAAEEIEAIEAFRKIETSLSANQHRGYQHALNLAMAAAMSSFESTSSLIGVVNSIRGMQQSLSSYAAVAGKDEAAIEIRHEALKVEAQLQAQISNPNLPEAARAGLQNVLNVMRQQRTEATAEMKLQVAIIPDAVPTMQEPLVQAQRAADAKAVSSVQPANVNAIGALDISKVGSAVLSAPVAVAAVPHQAPTSAVVLSSNGVAGVAPATAAVPHQAPVSTTVMNSNGTTSVVPAMALGAPVAVATVVTQAPTSLPSAPQAVSAITVSTLAFIQPVETTSVIQGAVRIASVSAVAPAAIGQAAPPATLSTTQTGAAHLQPAAQNVMPAATANTTATVVSLAEARAAQPLAPESLAPVGGNNVVVLFRVAANDSVQPQTPSQATPPGLPATANLYDREPKRVVGVSEDDGHKKAKSGFDPFADYYDRKVAGTDTKGEQRQSLPLGLLPATNGMDDSSQKTLSQPFPVAPQQANVLDVSGLRQSAGAQLVPDMPAQAVSMQDAGVQQQAANTNTSIAVESNPGAANQSSTIVVSLTTQNNGQAPVAGTASPTEHKVVNPHDHSDRELYKDAYEYQVMQKEKEKKGGFNLLDDFYDHLKNDPKDKDDERRNLRHHDDDHLKKHNSHDAYGFASSTYLLAYTQPPAAQNRNDVGDVGRVKEAFKSGGCATCSGCGACSRGASGAASTNPKYSNG